VIDPVFEENKKEEKKPVEKKPAKKGKDEAVEELPEVIPPPDYSELY